MQSKQSFDQNLSALKQGIKTTHKRSTIDAQALLLAGLIFGSAFVFDALVYLGYYLFILLKH